MTKPASLHRSESFAPRLLVRGQKTVLLIVAFTALLSLSIWVNPAWGKMLPPGWRLMNVYTCLAFLAGAASLALSLRTRRSAFAYVEQLLAGTMGLAVAIDLLAHFNAAGVRFDGHFAHRLPSSDSDPMSLQSATVLLLLAVVIFFVRARKGISLYIVDVAIFGVMLSILVIDFGYLFNASPLLGVPATHPFPIELLSILTLLSLAAMARRSKCGALSVLMNSGSSGRITCALAPIVLLLPFAREAGRARLMSMHWVPERYDSPILALLAAVLSMGLLLFIGWRMYGMEREIDELGLRDEMTELYNLRGFRLLAEQALLIARRTELPFSVLFINLDNLELVNDSLGRSVGSAFLAETGELLKASFRETDVLGRVSGDEFAVAGQFSRTAISIAAHRLEEQAALGGRTSGTNMPLSFSIGYVTSELRGDESLADLLKSANAAMYDQKRRKKLQLC